MTPHQSPGLTPDDVPIDVSAVAADDACVERMRAALSVDEPRGPVVWGDEDVDEQPDEALRLLGLLRDDVWRNVPAPDVDLLAALSDGGYAAGFREPATAAPYSLVRELSHGAPRRAGTVSSVPTATVTPFPVAGHRSRPARRAAAVLGAAAAVLSVAGVAAASPGTPVAGLRHAMARAVTGGLNAVSPSTDAPRRDTGAGPGAAGPEALHGRSRAGAGVLVTATAAPVARTGGPSAATHPATGRTPAQQAAGTRGAAGGRAATTGAKRSGDQRATARPSTPGSGSHGKAPTARPAGGTAKRTRPRPTAGSHGKPTPHPAATGRATGTPRPAASPKATGSPRKSHGPGPAPAQPSSDASAKPRA